MRSIMLKGQKLHGWSSQCAHTIVFCCQGLGGNNILKWKTVHRQMLPDADVAPAPAYDEARSGRS
jgi:hypothetical protein